MVIELGKFDENVDIHVDVLNVLTCSDLELPIKAYELANQLDMELRASKFPCAKEQTRPPRLVRVGLLQHRMPQPACEPIEKQRQAAHHRVKQMLEVAALAKVNVVCLEEIWSKFQMIFWINYCKNIIRRNKQSNVHKRHNSLSFVNNHEYIYHVSFF